MCIQINACVQVVNTSPLHFAVCVTKTALSHNHGLGLRTYRHYPANRLAIEEDVLATVDSLRKSGTKTQNILKFIVENTSSDPTPQDVRNLIRKLKKQDQGVSSRSQRIKKWMVDFCAVQGNVGHIFVDPSGGKVRFASQVL